MFAHRHSLKNLVDRNLHVNCFSNKASKEPASKLEVYTSVVIKVMPASMSGIGLTIKFSFPQTVIIQLMKQLSEVRTVHQVSNDSSSTLLEHMIFKDEMGKHKLGSPYHPHDEHTII